MRNKRKAFIVMIMGLTLSVSLLGCNSKGNVSVDNEGLEGLTGEEIEINIEEWAVALFCFTSSRAIRAIVPFHNIPPSFYDKISISDICELKEVVI